MRSDEEIYNEWFISDPHLLHPKIVAINNRPTTIEEHDEWLIDRINSKVKKKDNLYIIGDVSLGSKVLTEKLLDRINGNKTLILGNHDNNIHNSTRFKEIKLIKDYNFNSPHNSNIHIVLCHYPILSWNRKKYGSWHLFGHVHGKVKGVGLSHDVGVDNNSWYPISLAEVIAIMNEKFNQIN